ncbi:uncharacterized protein METZ01_LOCUS161961, partial [marine metagenome]
MSINLNWRPTSYSDFGDPTSLIVNGIQGQRRRDSVRRALTIRSPDPLGVYAEDEAHWLEDRWSVGFIDTMSYSSPDWKVGECLPDFLWGEIEIARVAVSEWEHLYTESGEQRKIDGLVRVISIRARRRSGRYRYRALDDHKTQFDLRRKSSRRTLTLGQLIDLLETGEMVEPGSNGAGLVVHWWNEELRRGCWKVEGVPAPPSQQIEGCMQGSQVQSDLYADLPVWYEKRAEDWL